MATEVFRAKVGSQLSGLCVEGSDVDFLSVTVETLGHYAGLLSYKEAGQENDGQTDVRQFDVRKFGKLLLAGNYNCVSSLFDAGAFVHPAFERFVTARNLFCNAKLARACAGQAVNDVRGDAVTDKAFARSLHLLSEASAALRTGTLHVEASDYVKAVRAGLCKFSRQMAFDLLLTEVNGRMNSPFARHPTPEALVGLTSDLVTACVMDVCSVRFSE